jgi:hypothetical protein
VTQDVGQRAEPKLGGTTTTARVLSQPQGGTSFGRHGHGGI